MRWLAWWLLSFTLCCATSAKPAAQRYTEAYDDAFQRWSRVYTPYDPWQYLKAVGIAESGLNRDCRNASTGALGLMQFMPGTAAALGINPLDPESAIMGAAMYNRMNQAPYGDASPADRRDLALASYDAGPATVAKAARAAGSHRWQLVAAALATGVVAYVLHIETLVGTL